MNANQNTILLLGGPRDGQRVPWTGMQTLAMVGDGPGRGYVRYFSEDTTRPPSDIVVYHVHRIECGDTVVAVAVKQGQTVEEVLAGRLETDGEAAKRQYLQARAWQTLAAHGIHEQVQPAPPPAGKLVQEAEVIPESCPSTSERLPGA